MSQSRGGATAVVRFDAIGTDVVMHVTRPASVAAAEDELRRELDAIDRACSRFRADAEIALLHEQAGNWVPVSALLFEALRLARDVAERTDGAVDPTVGSALCALGYDRDFAAIHDGGPVLVGSYPVAGWRALELDVTSQQAKVAPGVLLDLGATAKALAADRSARAVAALGTGALVSLGGDIAVAGPPPEGGWSIGIAEESAAPAAGADQVVALRTGGLATSSTRSRVWRRGGRQLHHIVDPTTGTSATAHWRLVTVAAGSCVDANAASTAAVVWGLEAPARLAAMGLPARLVAADGAVVTTPGWPAPSRSPERLLAAVR